MNCPAFISLRASKCGQYLQVVQVCNQHNHEISENAIKRTPQYRKLTPQVKEEVLHMLSANIQRNEIIKYVQLRAGIELISKNFNNFMVELKSGKKYETNPAVFERIQRFLERNKSVLAVNACQQMSGGEEDALIEPPKSVLEPYVDIEERYASTMEVDAKMERTNENYVYVDGGCELDEVIESRQSTRCQEYEGTIMEEPQGEMWQISLENRIVVDGTPDDIIEVVQMPGYLETEQPTVQSQCVNCMKAKSAKSLRSEIKTLRQMKRRMIRETNALNRKKHKLLNHIKQLEWMGMQFKWGQYSTVSELYLEDPIYMGNRNFFVVSIPIDSEKICQVQRLWDDRMQFFVNKIYFISLFFHTSYLKSNGETTDFLSIMRVSSTVYVH